MALLEAVLWCPEWIILDSHRWFDPYQHTVHLAVDQLSNDTQRSGRLS